MELIKPYLIKHMNLSNQSPPYEISKLYEY